MGLEGSVIFTGLVSADEKLEILKAAKLFVLTSHSDAQPIAVQDSMIMGTPVVITEACNYPEVDSYNAGIIVKPEIGEIYSAIKRMLESKDLDRMSENAKRLIEMEFSPDAQIKKYSQMYEETVSRHRNSGLNGKSSGH